MRNLLSLTLGLFAVSALTPAAELVRYTFGTTGQETTVETSPVFNATVMTANLTASPVRDPNNTVGIESSSATTTPVGAPFLRVDPQGNSVSALAAIAANKYFEVTFTPEASFALNLESLSLDATRGGASTPRGFALRSSVDNFAANLAGVDLTTSRPTYTSFPVTLDSSFSGLTAPVSFRFYVYAPAAGNSIDFDNLSFSGSVVAVPEPGTISLIAAAGVGLAAVAARRRRA